VLVGLTKKGLTLIERANAAYVEHKTELLASLDETELAQVDTAIQILLDVLTEEHERATRRGVLAPGPSTRRSPDPATGR